MIDDWERIINRGSDTIDSMKEADSFIAELFAIDVKAELMREMFVFGGCVM